MAPILLLGACSTDPRAASRRYIENGNRYFQRGKYKEASILYRRALGKDPKFADAWYDLGLTNSQLAIFAEARRDFARAMDLDPANTPAAAKLADLDLVFYAVNPQANRAALADAKDLARRLLKRNPKSYDGLRVFGDIALIDKDLKGAIQNFQQANEVSPHQPELVLALAQTLLADHRDQEAELLAEDLIATEKTYGPMYDFLYVDYLRTRRPVLAEKVLQQKIENNPSEGAYLMQLAFHYYLTNRRAEMDSTVERLTSKGSVVPEARLQAGDFYVRIRDFDKALEQYQLGQKENARTKRLCQKKIVEVLGTQGRKTQAASLLSELLRENPDDPETIALRATLELEEGGERHVQHAISQLEPLVRKMASNATLHFNLGRAYMARGARTDPDQARIQFEEALRIDAKHLAARLSLAELALRRGDSARAVQQAERILSVDPANTTARLFRARGLKNMAEFDKARDELAILLQMNPASNDARFELGDLDLRERRYREAEDNFQRLLASGDLRGLPGVIEARVRQGNWEQAIRLIRGLSNQAPERSDYRMLLAGVLFRARRYSEAEPHFAMLVERNTSSAELYLKLGECKARRDDMRGAIAAFDRARAITPNDPAPDLALAMLFEHAGRLGEAHQSYQEAIRKRPDNPTALNNLAYLEAEDGSNLDQALAYAQRARAQLPGDRNVTDTLALIYLKKNLTEDALRMLRELVSREPDNATFHRHLALALYQKGDRPTARRELEAARRSKPTEKELDRIKELLAKVG
ncbi:MAG TPA: tetratricopeptide repeat protein [Bryobacteraceae bacterium]|nr:tetratricopeptide repeat protein [Bryobacteraceae bacterium]